MNGFGWIELVGVYGTRCDVWPQLASAQRMVVRLFDQSSIIGENMGDQYD